MATANGSAVGVTPMEMIPRRAALLDGSADFTLRRLLLEIQVWARANELQQLAEAVGAADAMLQASATEVDEALFQLAIAAQHARKVRPADAGSALARAERNLHNWAARTGVIGYFGLVRTDAIDRAEVRHG